MGISGFIDHLKFGKRYSGHTITAYNNDLRQYSEYLRNTYDLDDLLLSETLHIRSWIVDMAEKHMAPRSVNRKLVAVKSFFRYCNREGLINNDPSEGLSMLKTGRRLPEFIDEASMEQLLEEVYSAGDFPSLRNRLILELFYQTGIRLSELIGITRGQISKGTDSIKVTGKRNKQRIIPVGNKLLKLVGEYVSLRDEMFGSDMSYPLILTDKGKPLYTKFVYNIVNRSLSNVTTLTRRSPHVIRHTFATAMLNNGADINAVKELLGHSTLASTQVYTHNSVEKLKRVYKQAHPRA